jgi:hypothetical protein
MQFDRCEMYVNRFPVLVDVDSLNTHRLMTIDKATAVTATHQTFGLFTCSHGAVFQTWLGYRLFSVFP